MNRPQRRGLSPTTMLIRGLHAPKPPWDLRGIGSSELSLSGSKKAHGVLPAMSLDYSSDDPIPLRLLPSRAASASDQTQIY